ncbi:MAG: hypothetical protein AB1665_02450 [Candidatus Thermoplasmatota archaeon]
MRPRALFYTAIILLILFIPVHAWTVLAQDGVVVENVPPAFSDVEVIEGAHRTYINVTIEDYNSYTDILYLEILVLDEDGGVLSNITYHQYEHEAWVANETLVPPPRVRWFEEHTGAYLLPAECRVWYYSAATSDWYRANHLMTVLISYTPFSGKTVMITAYDIKFKSARYVGPFSSHYVPPPLLQEIWEFYDPVAVPVGLSILAAVITTALVTMRRAYSNRLARLVEAAEAKASAAEGAEPEISTKPPQKEKGGAGE